MSALATGDEVEVNMETNVLTELGSGKTFGLKPLGRGGLRCRWLPACTSSALQLSVVHLHGCASALMTCKLVCVPVCTPSHYFLRTFTAAGLSHALEGCDGLQAAPVVDAGGIFAYARAQGMIKTAA